MSPAFLWHILPPQPGGHRAGLRKPRGCWWRVGGWPGEFLDSCEENLISLPSQAPGGAIVSAPKSTGSQQFSPAAAQRQLGKHKLFQGLSFWLLLLSPSHVPHPRKKNFFKANQEGAGVWDLVQTILEGARSSQKLLPPRGLHSDCSLK